MKKMTDVFFDMGEDWIDNDPKQAFDNEKVLLPDGVYDLIITGTKMNLSKAGQKYLSLTSRVIDGDFKGAFVFDNVFAWYESPDLEKQTKVLKINRAKINMLRLAAGIDGIFESDGDFVGVLYRAKVKIKIDKDGQYPDKNEISRYFPDNIGGKLNPNDVFSPSTLSTPAQVPVTSSPQFYNANGELINPETGEVLF